MTTTQQPPTPTGKEHARPRLGSDSGGSRLLHQLGRFGLVIGLIVVFVTFSLWTPASFFTWNNVTATFDQQAIILMVAFGAMLPLIVGEFDLSIGANAGIAILATVGLCSKQGLDPWLAIVCAVGISTLIGLINGLVVTQFHVSSFVATLGMATLLSGLAELYTGGVNLATAPTDLTDIGRSELLGLALPVWIAAFAALVLIIGLQKLRVGRELLAVGLSPRAAELTGIRTTPRIVLAFTVGGAVGGIGGAFYGAEVGSASLDTGAALLLPGFAGAFLGATAITPGRFNVLGTITGVLLLAFTVGGLQQLGVKPWINSAVQGVALIVAVALSTWAIRLRAARLRRAQLDYLAAEDAATT